jgi:DNA primase
MTRFSKTHLSAVRNNIPIDHLISNVLLLPVKKTDGVFRFLCPLCSEFQTAVNPRTNLARCFRCSKNFNTIDLVIEVRKVNFKQAVSLLSSHLKLPNRHSVKKQPQSSLRAPSTLTSIRDVLKQSLDPDSKCRGL